MKNNNYEKRVFAFVFFVGCFIFAYLSINKTYLSLKDYFSTYKVTNISKMKDDIKEIDNIVNENVAYRYDLIESYGYIMKVIGKKEVNGFEYVIDKNGYLNSGNFWANVHDRNSEQLAVRVKRMEEDLKKKNIKMVILAMPEKYNEKYSTGYSGIPYNNHKYVMDEYLMYARKYRIPIIDFQDTLTKSGLAYDDIFYKTDHHWTPRAAYESFKELVNVLNDQYGMNLDENMYYRNLDNYNIEVYKNMMLGSEGRSTGMAYAPAEDFELIYPKDNNKYDLYLNNGNKEWSYSGTLKESLLTCDGIKLINENRDEIYENSLYDIYLHGIKSETKITNKTNKDGPRVLLLRDSFSDPLATFMAPLCSEIDMLWTKEYTGDIEKYIKKNNYNIVFVSFYPDDLTEEFFKFYEK